MHYCFLMRTVYRDIKRGTEALIFHIDGIFSDLIGLQKGTAEAVRNNLFGLIGISHFQSKPLYIGLFIRKKNCLFGQGVNSNSRNFGSIFLLIQDL